MSEDKKNYNTFIGFGGLGLGTIAFWIQDLQLLFISWMILYYITTFVIIEETFN